MRRFLPLFLILISTATTAWAQSLTGKVISSVDKSELPGVNVVIKGTAQGTITDISGNFSIDVPSGETLVFSFIGYKSQELIYNGQTNVAIMMEEQAKELSEIVIVGYSSVEKKDITGA